MCSSVLIPSPVARSSGEPKWGDGGYDLYMGGTGALGAIGSCYMGSTYAPNDICGGNGSWDWNETNMEVWYLAGK